MSDLISRSEVNDVIDELEVYTCGRPNTAKVEVSVLQLQRLINKLKNIPTAYDIDKVVEELGERKTLHERLVEYETKNGTVTEKYQHIKAIDVLNDAIEIVKHGGVSDDVCEWKKSKDYPFDWLVGCDGCEVNHRQGDYCPRCGKKIKVV